MALQSGLSAGRLAAFVLLGLSLGLSVRAQSSGSTFGEVISLGGTPYDVVLDESRGVLYLVNANANKIDIYDYVNKQMSGSIAVGTFPTGAAMSMDNNYLYVTNTQSSTLSVINLNGQFVQNNISLPAKPEGIAVGVDGRALITTQGTGTNNALNTLLLFDATQDQGQQVLAITSAPPLSTPNPLPAVFVGRPATPYPGRLIRTPDGNFIIGMVAINQTTNNANTQLFVYEVASGVVLQNRLVTGQSTVLSIAPDGSKFMAGSTLYDTATLNVLAQMNPANLPFLIGAGTNPASFNLGQNFGGSIFSSDGSTIYNAFNQAATNARPVANVLYVSRANNLGVSLGIRLPQSILGKMVITSDGNDAFALSESGMIHLPLSTMYDNPIIQADTTQVFLAQDDCNKGVAKASVQVTNLGKGKLTFSLPTVTTALVTQISTGMAPATIDFVMDPGRSGVVRQAGTNLFTGAAGGGGAPINITLSSREAINIPNTIRVFMNYRQSDQRGIIFPVPSSLNITEGLQQMVLDEPREKLYITNSGYNRVEVFDTKKQKFADPIDVGQRPGSMAMSLGGSTLYVANRGGESISIVDLDSETVTGGVNFPPIPRAGNQNAVTPVAMAMGLSGLQFMMSNGGFWRTIGNDAVPRATSAVTPATIAAPQYMTATAGGEYILTLAGNGNGYLYNGLLDTYTASRQLYDQTPVSYYGAVTASPAGNFFVVSGLTLNSALAIIGGAERPGQTQVTPAPAPGQPPTITVVSAGLRNVAAVYPIDDNNFVRLTTPVRQNATATTRDEARPTLELVNTRTGAQSVVAVAPDTPVQSVFGTTRVNVPSRQLVVDSKGTAYAITLSGLSMVPLAMSGNQPRPQVLTGSRGIVNSSDGTPLFKPGSFITISGSALANAATADNVPLPTVLGGSCVTFDDVAIPLLQTSTGQISAQLPATIRPGQNVVQVRSLATASASDPVIITVQKP